jgi:hypothetical protein
LHSASSGDGGGNKGDFIVGSYADGYELGKEHGKNNDRNNSGFDATCPDGNGLSYCA